MSEQAVVVARMQADRRLVEDVEHADQPAADLPGQPDPLHFAAGKRRRGAVEREILEPHVAEELQPAADFLEHLGGDLLAAWRPDPARRRTRPRRKPPGAQTSGSERSGRSANFGAGGW